MPDAHQPETPEMTEMAEMTEAAGMPAMTPETPSRERRRKPERSAALRKLLEAKDAAVRAGVAAARPSPADREKLAEIRARHEAADKDSGYEWAGLYAEDAHDDRAWLLEHFEGKKHA